MMTSRSSICLIGRCSLPMNQPWVMGMKPQPPTTENRPALIGRHFSCWNLLERVTPTVETPAEQLKEKSAEKEVRCVFHFSAP